MPQMKKIDIHCHTTNRILKDVANPDASLATIAGYMRQYGIVKTILLATYFPRRGTGISNFRMHYWIQGKPEFLMFGSLDFEHFFYQGINELEELAEEGLIKGIKLYPAYQQIDFTSAQFKQVVTLAAEKNLPLMFHGGVSYMLWKKLGIQNILTHPHSLPAQAAGEPYKTPGEFEKVAQLFPSVNIIVSHLCKPFFEEMIEVLKRNDNLFTDMSGILDSRTDAAYKVMYVEQIKRFLGECGPEKMMFGTDFPVQTHEDSLYFIEQAMQNYPAEDRQKVYFENAHKLILKGEEGTAL
jgi:predicted TIM-barrel fold metal-dependent hydrolase